ncbi:translation initiation factor IF-2-like, partial [Phacochoerus africanus]|uniref:translation initiation factor IF-2-like n=1 Tax=Phacochoerus africanus TaxID=41426 RepID=UPI001FDA5B2D
LPSGDHAQAPAPRPPPETPAARVPPRGRGRRRRKPVIRWPPRSAINHFARAPRAPPGILRPAAGGAALRRPSGVRLSRVSLLPNALPAPLGGRRGVFPTVVTFAKSKRKPRAFQGARPGRRAGLQQAPALRSRVPGSRRRPVPTPAGRRRVGLGAGPGHARRRGAHRKAGGRRLRPQARWEPRRRASALQRAVDALKAPTLEKLLLVLGHAPGPWRALLPG